MEPAGKSVAATTTVSVCNGAEVYWLTTKITMAPAARASSPPRWISVRPPDERVRVGRAGAAIGSVPPGAVTIVYGTDDVAQSSGALRVFLARQQGAQQVAIRTG